MATARLTIEATADRARGVCSGGIGEVFRALVKEL